MVVDDLHHALLGIALQLLAEVGVGWRVALAVDQLRNLAHLGVLNVGTHPVIRSPAWGSGPVAQRLLLLVLRHRLVQVRDGRQ